MELFKHISNFMGQVNNSLVSFIEAPQVNTIDQMAQGDRFLEHKVSRIERFIEDANTSIDERANGIYSEYKEALAYIHVSRSF